MTSSVQKARRPMRRYQRVFRTMPPEIRRSAGATDAAMCGRGPTARSATVNPTTRIGRSFTMLSPRLREK